MAGVRILVADSHEIVRHGLRKLFEDQPGWEVCGETASGGALVDLATSLTPDIVVLGVPLAGVDPVAVTRRLRAGGHGPEVILYAAGDDLEAVSATLTAGARGCVLKADELGQLTAAIGAVLGRRAYLSPAAAQLLGQAAEDGRQPSAQEHLTSREMQVVQLIAEGESSRKIAEILKISPKTAESHRAAAMRKSGARSVAHLIRFAIRRRLISS